MKKAALSGWTISIFIILGLVILFAWMYRNTFIQTEMDISDEVEEQLHVTDSIQDAVKFYITDCLEQTSVEAIEKMAYQGGYMDIPSNLSFELINGRKVPYWDIEKYPLPSYDSIENNLSVYIKNNIDNCLKFDAFKGFNITRGNKSIEVESNTNIIVRMKYPFKFQRFEEVYDFTDSIVTIPIDINKSLFLAKRIYLSEYMFNFLEIYTNSLISTYSLLSPDALPPRFFLEAGLNCSVVEWDVNKVEKKTAEILRNGFNFLKIGPSMGAILDNQPYVYEIFNNPEPNVDISVIFNENYSYYFDINPKMGDKLEAFPVASNLISEVPTLCLLRYEFFYNLDFPVMIHLVDYDSAKVANRKYYPLDGFEFEFLIETIIVRNHNRKDPTVIGLLDDFFDDVSDALSLYSNKGCNDVQKYATPLLVMDDELKPLSGADIYFDLDGIDCFAGTSRNGYSFFSLPTDNIVNITIEHPKYKNLNFLYQDNGQEKTHIIMTDEKIRLLPKIYKIDLRQYIKTPGVIDSWKKHLDPTDSAILTLINNGHKDLYNLPVDEISLLDNENYSYQISLLGEKKFIALNGSIIEGIYPIGEMPKINFSTTSIDDGDSIEFYIFDKFVGVDTIDIQNLTNPSITNGDIGYVDDVIYTLDYDYYYGYMRPKII